MKKTPWIAGAALAASLATVTAFAAAPDGPPRTRADVQARVADHFKTIDTNGDGYVTQAEADAARATMREKFAERRADRREQHFAMLDTDKNGSLSKDEYMTSPPRGERAGGPDGKGRGHGRHAMMRHGMGTGMSGNWFARADVNKDSKVSLAEASTSALSRFDRIDTNHDGTISAEEHDAARDAMRAKMKAKWDAGREAPKS